MPLICWEPARSDGDSCFCRRATTWPNAYVDGLEGRGDGSYRGRVGQREPHAGGPGGGFRDHRNRSSIQAAPIYLIGEIRPQRLHYCDVPLGRFGSRKGTLGQSWKPCRDQVTGRQWPARAVTLLVSVGSFGHSFAPAGPYGFCLEFYSRGRTMRLPARCKSLIFLEQGHQDPLRFESMEQAR